jgi:glutamate-5-semialdehyde dehydrogenase
MSSIKNLAKQAKKVSIKMSGLSTDKKNELLLKIANNIRDNHSRIEAANKLDVENAEKMVEAGTLSQALLKRLILSGAKIDQLSTYLEQVANLPDPVGIQQYAIRLADNLELFRTSSPIGVVAVIFESRPEVNIQVSALSLKSGNAVILKGGKEAAHSNRTLYEIIDETLAEFGLKGAVNHVETREDIAQLLNLDKYVDLIIPRGSNELVRHIQENTKIHVLGHADGICHVYIDNEMDLNMAVEIVHDAKTNYPAVCNAVETLLIHRDVAEEIIPPVFQRLIEAGVELRGCEKTSNIAMAHNIKISPATDEDWATEYTDLILSVKLVDSLQEAIDHINEYGSHHTDSIVTSNHETAQIFLNNVDSGCVFHNASTRFSDGYVFGLGAEVGISTGKIHARGPVGLDGLVIYKYILRGNGHVIAKFSGKDGQPFLHELLM